MEPYYVKIRVPAAGPWVGQSAVWGAAGINGRQDASAAGSAGGAVADVDVSGRTLPAAYAAAGAEPG